MQGGSKSSAVTNFEGEHGERGRRTGAMGWTGLDWGKPESQKARITERQEGPGGGGSGNENFWSGRVFGGETERGNGTEHSRKEAPVSECLVREQLTCVIVQMLRCDL